MASAKRSPGQTKTVAEGVTLRNGAYAVWIWNPDKGANGGKEWHTLGRCACGRTHPGQTQGDAKALRRLLQDEKRDRVNLAAEMSVGEWAGHYEEDFVASAPRRLGALKAMEDRWTRTGLAAAAGVPVKRLRAWLEGDDSLTVGQQAAVAELLGLADADLVVTRTRSERQRRWVPGKWVELCPRPAASTNVYNDGQVRAFAREFAGRSLASIKEEEAARFALAHPSTVKVVRAMLNDALAKRLIMRNPFQAVKSVASDGRRRIVVLTDAELEQLCAMATAIHGDYGSVVAAMIRTAAWTGMRPGELFLLSMEPDDQMNYVDFDAGLIHVDWQETKDGGVTRPKNGSQREVILLPPAEAALRSIKSWQAGLPVFLTKYGKPFNQRNHFYYWHPIRSAFVASLPPGHQLRQRAAKGGPGGDGNLDFYELRHFFGTKLAHPPPGVPATRPQDIAAMMGHRDGGELAMRVYVHTNADDARARIRSAWAKAS